MSDYGSKSGFGIEGLSFLLLIILVLSIGLLGIWIVPAADDYTNANVIREIGPVDYVAKIFKEWSGRIFSTALIGATFLSYDFFPLSSMILGFSFILLPLLTLRGFGFGHTMRSPHLATLCISIAFLAGLTSFLAEDVFWPTGGWVYQFCSFAYVAWLVGFHFALKRGNIIATCLLFLAGIVLGTAHEQLSLPFLLLASLLVLRKFAQLRSQKEIITIGHFLLWLPVLSIALGTALLLLAPGNYARAAVVYPSGTEALTLNLISVLKNATELVRMMFANSFEAIFFGCLAGIAVGVTNWKAGISRNHKMLQLGLSGVLLACALLTLVPLIPYPKFAAHRTFFFGAEFLFAAALVFVQLLTAQLIRSIVIEKTRYKMIVSMSLASAGCAFAISQLLKANLKFGVVLLPIVFSMVFVLFAANRSLTQKISAKAEGVCGRFFKQRSKLWISVAGVLVSAAFAASLIVPQYSAAIPYKKTGNERHAFMATIASAFPAGSFVEVPPYTNPPPSWFHFNDISADSAHWINLGVGEFYQIGDRKIVLKTGP